MLLIDLPCFNRHSQRIQMVSFHVLFGDLCAQTKLEGVHPAATCGSLRAVSSSTDKDTQGSQFSDQISGLAFFERLCSALTM